MENNWPTTTPEYDKFCLDLTKRVPELMPLWEEHMNDPIDDPLPYIFMADSARWAEQNATTSRNAVLALVNALNDGLDYGEGNVPNLIAAGFVEAMSRDTPFIPLVTGSLKSWVDFDFGFSSIQPHLRGQ